MGEIWGGSREEEQGGNLCLHRAVFWLKGSVPAPVVLKTWQFKIKYRKNSKGIRATGMTSELLNETSNSHGIGKEREQRPEMSSHSSTSLSLCSFTRNNKK